MIPEYPQNESVLSWSEGSLSRCQQSWLRLLERVDDLWNTTMLGLEDRVSMGYQNEPLVHYLARLRARIHNESSFIKGECPNRYVFGVFSLVLLYCRSSLYAITQIPTSELRRVVQSVPANKARHFGNKTAQWLSRRPGYTVAEKIAPKNEILSEITIFTADTKENREAYYLYENLYLLLGKSLDECACAKCENHKCGQRALVYESMRSLFQKRSFIKSNSFNGVVKQKQAVPNNRLISDPNYKCVWDSTRKLTELDLTMKQRWESIFDGLISLFRNAIFAEITGYKNVKVYDAYGHLNRKSIGSSFVSMDGKVAIPLRARIELDDEIKRVTVYQEGKKIRLEIERFKRLGNAYEKAETKNIRIDFKTVFERTSKALIDQSGFADAIELLSSKLLAFHYQALPYLPVESEENFQ